MPDYSTSTIYKICCKDPSIKDCYVGSTTTNVNKIRCRYKSTCNNKYDMCYNYPIYKCIRENGGWNNWNFEILQEASLENRKQVLKLKREWVEKLDATLNKCLPLRSKSEYNKKYNEEHKEHRQKWRDDRKEYKKEYNKKYRKDNTVQCICGRVICNLRNHLKTKVHRDKIAELKRSLHTELLSR